MNLIIKAPQFFTGKTLKGKTDTQTKNKSKNNPNYHQLKAKTIENSRKKKKTLFVCGCFSSLYCIVSLFHAFSRWLFFFSMVCDDYKVFGNGDAL